MATKKKAAKSGRRPQVRMRDLKPSKDARGGRSRSQEGAAGIKRKHQY